MIISEFKTNSVLKGIGARYRAWHTAGGVGGSPSRSIPMGSPGSGREFFEFHQSIIDQFVAWNAVHHAVAHEDIAPWTAVPAELKVPETGWPTPWPGLDLAVAEIRLHTNVPPFANEDELGIFVESTVLNWIHGALAAAPAFDLATAEQKIVTGLQSPESSWFYKIHGLAQSWRSRFLHPESRTGFKEIVDFKEINDVRGSVSGFKVDFKEINDAQSSGRGFKEIIDFKEINDIQGSVRGLKEILDNPGGKDFKEILDAYSKQAAVPSVLTNLLERVKELEARLQVKKSPFIKPFQRPKVGASVVRSKRKKNP